MNSRTTRPARHPVRGADRAEPQSSQPLAAAAAQLPLPRKLPEAACQAYLRRSANGAHEALVEILG